MSSPFAVMNQRFINWLEKNGTIVVYKLPAGDRTIYADFEQTSANESEGTGRKTYIRRGVLRIADHATDGVLASEISRKDTVAFGGKVWSVEDEGVNDGCGMITLNIVHVEEVKRERSELVPRT